MRRRLELPVVQSNAEPAQRSFVSSMQSNAGAVPMRQTASTKLVYQLHLR
jgi:hypothetical protein